MVLLFLSELQFEVYTCRAPASFFRVALVHYVVAWPYRSFLGWLHLSRDLWKPRWSMDMRFHRPCVPGHGGRWAMFVFIPTWLWHLTLHGSFCSDSSSPLLLLLWPGPGGQAENCPHPQWLPCLARLFPWESPLWLAQLWVPVHSILEGFAGWIPKSSDYHSHPAWLPSFKDYPPIPMFCFLPPPRPVLAHPWPSIAWWICTAGQWYWVNNITKWPLFFILLIASGPPCGACRNLMRAPGPPPALLSATQTQQALPAKPLALHAIQSTACENQLLLMGERVVSSR